MKITLDKVIEMLQEDPNAPVEGRCGGWSRLRRVGAVLQFQNSGGAWGPTQTLFEWTEFRTIRTVTIYVPDDVEVKDGKITLNGEYGVEE